MGIRYPDDHSDSFFFLHAHHVCPVAPVLPNADPTRTRFGTVPDVSDVIAYAADYPAEVSAPNVDNIARLRV